MTKSVIIKKAIEFFEKNKILPKRTDLLKEGITRDMVRHYFGSFESLNKILLNKLELFTIDTAKIYNKDSKKYSRYIITTAVSGCEVNEEFLKTLLNYSKINKAELLILPIIDKNNPVFDKKLLKFSFVEDFTQLNDNCIVLNLKESYKKSDPTKGLDHLTNNHKTIILPGIELRLRFVPCGFDNFPKALMTTGSITKPDFIVNPYNSKNSFILNNNFIFSALVVEIEDSKHFHFRQLIANNEFHINDLGITYTQNSTKKADCVTVLGDWHCGKTNLNVKKETLRLLKRIKPEAIVLHDLFDGYSISHHEINKATIRAKKALQSNLSLEKELEDYANEIYTLSIIYGFNLVIVKSNHDEHLERYLDEVRFKDDPINFKIASHLISYIMNDQNPLKMFTLEKYRNKFLEKKVMWLKRDESYRYKNSDVELGAHGDKGANGAYPSLIQLERSYGNIVIGHRHTPEIRGKVWVVGTSTDLKLDYTIGPSSWINTHCIVYSDGTRQLVNFINNKFCL